MGATKHTTTNAKEKKLDGEVYLADPAINENLDAVEEVAAKIASCRSQGDYTGVSLYLGMLWGAVSNIRQRNNEIELDRV